MWQSRFLLLSNLTRIVSNLGSVEIWASPKLEIVIQAGDGAICADRCPVGEDGTALPGEEVRPRSQRRGQPTFVEAVLWIARTGSPWRDLPPLFGPWNTVFKRSRDWVKADVFKRLFDAVSDEPDMEYAMVDATIVKVHRHGQGAKGGPKGRPSAAPRAA